MKKIALASFAVVSLLLASCGEKTVSDQTQETVTEDTIATPNDSIVIETPSGVPAIVETPGDSTIIKTETTTETKVEAETVK